MVVVHINSDSQFNGELTKTGSTRLVVCDFFAEWCGPCRFIAPTFEQFSEVYSSALFLKIDVDNCRATAQMYQINAMPTFVLLLNNREVGRMQGANVNQLEALIRSNIPAASSSLNNESIATKEERSWLEKFVHLAEGMAIYEDDINQTLAVSVIPVEQLMTDSTVDNKLSQFLLAKNLLNWFHGFFKWVNRVDCEECKVDSIAIGDGLCTTDEKEDGASRVEMFRCPNCRKEFRFPRFNNPARLLSTRQGRCGEYANCFALCCRTVGLRTRWVNDNLDHVWVEIWADDLSRWIHCDPCENVIDTPLMYDKGWGKKHAYVFAFAVDHMQDVTWRYCFNHSAVMKRRKSCREQILRNFVSKLNNRLSKGMPDEQRNQLRVMMMKELVEFLWPANQLRNNSDAEAQGRSSGETEWKLARGELASENFIGTMIKPSQSEILKGSLILKYDVVNDRYVRENDEANNIIVGWKSLAYNVEHVFRKDEHDWRKTYLCRSAGKPKGKIVWRVEHSDLVVKKIELKLGHIHTLESGKVRTILCCGNFCSEVPLEGITLDDLEDAKYTEITVEMSGGKGDCAWQHAQLFRTDNRDPTENMSLIIHFENKKF